MNKDINVSIHILISQTAAGDEEALGELIGSCRLSITGFVRKNYGSALDDLDISFIVEEVMISIWENASKYTGQSDRSAWAWIYKIARSKAVDQIRENAKWDGHIDKLILATSSDPRSYIGNRPTESDSTHRLVKTEYREMWSAFPQYLSERQKEYLKWFLEGKSQSDIAELMDASRSQVSNLKKEVIKKGRGFFPKI